MKRSILVKIFFLIFSFIFIMHNFSFAANETEQNFSVDGFFDGAKSFIEDGKAEGENLIAKEGLQKISGTIYNTLFAVGMIAVVAVGIFLGIKIMTGSIEEQAQYKQLLIPYFIGGIIVFGAFGIWKIVVNIMQSTF